MSMQCTHGYTVYEKRMYVCLYWLWSTDYVQMCEFLWNKYSFIHYINTLRPRQNGRHFADDMFKCIFVNENVWIPIKISVKCVPKGPINNNPALFQIMAWHCPGDKPLSEPMMVRLPTHICVTWPQWVKQKGRFKVLWNGLWWSKMGWHVCFWMIVILWWWLLELCDPVNWSPPEENHACQTFCLQNFLESPWKKLRFFLQIHV